MRTVLMFKTPGAVERAVQEAAYEAENRGEDIDLLEQELNRFVQYGETLCVEYDTETKRVRVLGADESYADDTYGDALRRGFEVLKQYIPQQLWARALEDIEQEAVE